MADLNSGAKAYGDALFMLAEELSITEEVKRDADVVCALLEENPSYTSLLDSPALTREERLGLIDGSLGSLNKNLVNLVKILAEKRLAHILGKTLDFFREAYDRSRGIERVTVISAVPMTEAQTEKLRAKLEAITKKQIIVKCTIDPSLLGGMKLRYQGIQLDGTVRTKLDGFAKRLSELVI